MDKRAEIRWVITIVAVIILSGIFLAIFCFTKKLGAGNLVYRQDFTHLQLSSEAVVPSALAARGRVKLYGKTYLYYHEIESYLIIGTDASGNEEASDGEYRGGMADFLLLFVVNKTKDSCHILMLNRDTITEIPLMQTDGTSMASARLQLCTAHWYGGNRKQSCQNTVQAVSKMLGGIPINGYYSMDMDSIAVINHAVGGVTVKNESDFSDIDSSIKKGKTITLTDEQAVSFVRSRIHVDDGENTSRMARQIQYMEAFIKKVQSMKKGNAKLWIQLYQDLSNHSVTNITGKGLSRILNQISENAYEGICTFRGKTRLGSRLGDGLLHTEFILNKKSVRKVLGELYHLEE